jgi:hypothetical protein
MDAKAAAANGSVRGALLRIEDKLYESGVLVTAMGDSEAEVTLAFEEVAVGGGHGVCDGGAHSDRSHGAHFAFGLAKAP